MQQRSLGNLWKESTEVRREREMRCRRGGRPSSQPLDIPTTRFLHAAHQSTQRSLPDAPDRANRTTKGRE